MNCRQTFLGSNMGNISGYTPAARGVTLNTVDNTSHLWSQNLLIEKFGGKNALISHKAFSLRISENQ